MKTEDAVERLKTEIAVWALLILSGQAFHESSPVWGAVFLLFAIAIKGLQAIGDHHSTTSSRSNT